MFYPAMKMGGVTVNEMPAAAPLCHLFLYVTDRVAQLLTVEPAAAARLRLGLDARQSRVGFTTAWKRTAPVRKDP